MSLPTIPRANVRPTSLRHTQRDIGSSLNRTIAGLELLYRAAIEEAALYNNTGTYGNTAPIVNWAQEKPINEAALISANPVNGIITVGQDGWYTIDVWLIGTGSTNNATYGAYIDINGNNVFVGAQVWTQQAEGLVFAATLVIPLAKDDQVFLEAYCSAGTLTLNNGMFHVQWRSGVQDA